MMIWKEENIRNYQNKVSNADLMITEADFYDGFIIVQKGKKVFLKVTLSFGKNLEK